MLKLFGQNTIMQVTILLAVMIALWAHPLIEAQPMSPALGYAPLYTPLLALNIHPTLAVIAAVIFILLEGYYLNLMLTRASLTPNNNLLPALLYCTFMSIPATTLSPTLLANLVALPILNLLLLRGTSLTISSDKIFGAAALISISSMFYLPMITLLIAYLLVAVNYRLYNWRDWTMMILGLLAPYILLWGYHFATGTLLNSLTLTFESLTHFNATILPTGSLQSASNLFLAAITIWSVVALWTRLGEHPVVWQKNAITTMLPTLSGIAILFYSNILPVNLQFFAIPFALCGTQLLAIPNRQHPQQRKQWRLWYRNILFILIIIAAAIC